MPLGTKNTPNRRTGAAAVRLSAVSAGTMLSSSGNASVAPRPRSTVRRDRCTLLMNMADLLLSVASATVAPLSPLLQRPPCFTVSSAPEARRI